jgi:glycosyltransferase involved in cell wall biosynthesis
MKNAIRVQGIDKSITPKVSVIVPNYNHARFLRQRLDSILHQTFQDFELILLDDCSIDDSRIILSEYERDPRVRMQFNEENSGSTFKQWNKGVRLARGKYVWIAESDDYADGRFLERLVSRLDSDPEVVFAYCRSWRISREGKVEGFLDAYLNDLNSQKWTADFWADGREECTKYLFQRNTITGASSVLFRRDVYQLIGGADERLVFCGDWKTWASMALTGGKIAFLGEPLNFQRFHERTVTAKSGQFGVDVDEYLQVIWWILKRIKLTKADHRKLCEDLFPFWSPKVLTKRTPLGRRWKILKNGSAIDRKALFRLLPLTIVAIRIKLSNLLSLDAVL